MNSYKNQIGLIGLNDSSICLLRNLTRNCFSVSVFDYFKKNYKALKEEGFTCFDSIEEMIKNFFGQIIIFITGNWNDKLASIFEFLIGTLPCESIIIDMTNSQYEIIKNNFKIAKQKKINYLDGSLVGTLDDITWFPSLLISGDINIFNYLSHIFELISADNKKIFYFEKLGSSHFLKKIHNGIENSFVQSVIEGLSLIKKSDYSLNLQKVLNFFNNASLLESKIVNLISKGYDEKEIEPVGFENNTNELIFQEENDLNSIIKILINVNQKSPVLSTACFSSLKFKSSLESFSKNIYINFLKLKKVVDEE